MLCVPVLDGSGRAIAVIQAINKVGRGRGDPDEEVDQGNPTKPERSFTPSDEQILKALASHISVSLQRMYESNGEEAEMRLTDTIRMLKEYGLAGIKEEESSRIRRKPLFPEE